MRVQNRVLPVLQTPARVLRAPELHEAVTQTLPLLPHDLRRHELHARVAEVGFQRRVRRLEIQVLHEHDLFVAVLGLLLHNQRAFLRPAERRRRELQVQRLVLVHVIRKAVEGVLGEVVVGVAREADRFVRCQRKLASVI